MSKLIKNTLTISVLSLLIIFFTKYQWQILAKFKDSDILIVIVGLGLLGSFIELFVIKFGDLKHRQLFNVSARSIHSDIYKMMEILSVRLALKVLPEIYIFNDDNLIIKVIYKNFNNPVILISTKCIEHYTTKELEFALALKMVSIKNGNDSALKIYRGFVGFFWLYPAGIIKLIIDIEQSKSGKSSNFFSKLVYMIISVLLSLSGGFFAQLYLTIVEYYFDWNNYQQALVITKNKSFHFRHLSSEKTFSAFKLKFYTLLDQLLFGIQAKLNR